MEPGRSWEADPQRRILLDGAVATNLYAKGLPQDDCVEEWILSHPEAMQELEQQFIEAGCDIICAPTFGANRSRLTMYGHAEKVRDYNLRLTALARETAKRCAFSGKTVQVAGGLSAADLLPVSSNDIDFEELLSMYEEQANALNEANVDLFVLDAMPSTMEARAAILACRKYGKPIFVLMLLNSRGELLSGGSPTAAMIALQGLGIAGFGVSCSGQPNDLSALIQELAPFASVPLIVKADAGDPNPVLPGVYDLGPLALREQLAQTMDIGVTILAGGRGTTPSHIAELRKLMDNHTLEPTTEETLDMPDVLLASEREFFLLDHDRLEFTEPLFPEVDMADDLLAAEEDSFDVILVKVETPEDAAVFAANVPLARLPICIHSNSEEALERALFLYHGRCMVDRECAIPEKSLAAIAARYGTLVY